MSEVRSETFKLRRMYNAESVDSKAVLNQQKKVESVLTPEQRKPARQFAPGGGGG